jgi:hypothetical protein
MECGETTTLVNGKTYISDLTLLLGECPVVSNYLLLSIQRSCILRSCHDVILLCDPSHICPSSSEGFGVVAYRFQSSSWCLKDPYLGHGTVLSRLAHPSFTDSLDSEL